ncbi:Mycothiol acetyltransferase [Calothrix sp. NIES-4071]|nr:Mycothiol acetyltransferase [Calothrix sp. NIES-4071]BAZ60955.1 Mycothiol acetyltransferase [Calothrix sp. NIES-4105]
MRAITRRPLRGDEDLPAIANLINACNDVDRLDDGTSVQELREEFDMPSVDKARDLQLWEDENGILIGFGDLWITEPSEVIDGYLSMYVHPAARGKGLETEIIEWADIRMREVKIERNFPVKLRTGARSTQTERIKLLENNGFTTDRYFFRMERNLNEPIPEAYFSDGFALRFMNGEQDIKAWVNLYNNSFIDHWNFHPITVEMLKHWLKESSYRNDLDLLAVTADNSFVAQCYCYINLESNARTGRNEGHVGILGVRRGYRKIGLGRAMLLSGLHRLKQAGVDTARLGVDADNPNGALRLYESVGFQKVYASINFLRQV